MSKPKSVTKNEEVVIPAGSVRLYGILGLPPHAKGGVVFHMAAGVAVLARETTSLPKFSRTQVSPRYW